MRILLATSFPYIFTAGYYGYSYGKDKRTVGTSHSVCPSHGKVPDIRTYN